MFRSASLRNGQQPAPGDGIRPRFGDRPISHAEWQNSPALQALLPVGLQRASKLIQHFDDDSRYRFARYELSTPEHSRRGRPSSPCPAVAGAKPRDDGLRVASRLPPRSRLGAVMNRARAPVRIPAAVRSRTGRRRRPLFRLSSTYELRRAGRPPRVRFTARERTRPSALVSTRTAVGRAP